eukprot:4381397-Alexandrium_andersonii.AAC.1
MSASGHRRARSAPEALIGRWASPPRRKTQESALGGGAQNSGALLFVLYCWWSGSLRRCPPLEHLRAQTGLPG